MEQVDLDVVGKEEPPCEAIKQLAIGDVRPVEAIEEDDFQLQASTQLQRANYCLSSYELTGCGGSALGCGGSVPRRFHARTPRL